MLPTLLRKTVRDDRRAIIGWAVGLSALLSFYVPFWATMSDEEEAATAVVDIMPEGMAIGMGFADITSGAGWLEGIVYSIFGPLLLIMCAVVLGHRSVAVPEESGQLDQFLALPFTRRRFLVERFTALVFGVVVVAAAAWAVVVIFDATLEMEVGVGPLTAATLGLLLLALCFGTLAFAVGAATGSRGASLAAGGGAAVVAYLVRAMSQAGVEALEPLRWVSPFHYYLGGDPLRGDFPLAYFAVLAGIILVLVGIAVASFERRDVGV
jgi:ABC-2 type transport system permease protein